MRIVIDDQLPPELNDMAVTLAKIKALKPDMLVVSGHEKGAITAVTQIKAMKVRVPIIAMTHCDSAELAEKFAEASEHTFCAGQWHPELDYKDDLFGTAADFAKAFKAAYGYEAPYQAAQSAASVQVFADAFTRAPVARARQGSRRAGRDRTPDLFRQGEVRRGGAEHCQAHGLDARSAAANT